MGKLIISGNWKLNKTNSEALDLAKALKIKFVNIRNVDVVLHPPYTALSVVQEIINDSHISLGAQNIYWEKQGAYTGEISGEMLLSIGCQYVIIGHSERRQFFGESDLTVNKRLSAAIDAGLTPVICVGENLEERESGKTEDIVEKQIRGALIGISNDTASKLIIAYEPIWAIGTGKVATVQQANDVHRFIRALVAEMHGSDISQSLKIQYGGSVKPENANELLSASDIDGALVGGASLNAETFSEIVKIGEQSSK